MKRGFALLETIIVITFVTVSLLLLYGTFTNMVESKKKNILYDDVVNIYKVYYLKEYLELNGLKDVTTDNITKLSCNNFTFASCSSLFQDFSIANIYLVKYGIKNYDDENYVSGFNNYIRSLSNNGNYDYLLVGEFLIEDEYHYASIGVIK